MFPFMLFIFLCFFGILAVLLYMLRRQNQLYRLLHDEHKQLLALMYLTESQRAALKTGASGDTVPLSDNSAQTSVVNPQLAHLAFAPDDTGMDLHFDTLADDKP